MLDSQCTDKQAQVSFAVRIFDPNLIGNVTTEEFERTMRQLFASDTEIAKLEAKSADDSDSSIE